MPPEPRLDPPIFGYPELITALALLWVVYTVTDVRYKFRLAITPGALFPVTFFTFAAIALGTLISSIWAAEGWWVPRTIGLSQPILQGIFGVVLLACVFVWIYYAVIRPPVFGRRNATRYAQALFSRVPKGSDDELPVAVRTAI